MWASTAGSDWRTDHGISTAADWNKHRGGASPSQHSQQSDNSQHSPKQAMSSPASPRTVLGPSTAKALAVVTNKWYRDQRRADQEATRRLTLLKQRKISCIIKVESLVRGLAKEQEEQGAEDELREVERKIQDLEKEREVRARRIMDRRVLQVSTLQELGLLEAAGTQSCRNEAELKDGEDCLTFSQYSPASRKDSPQVLLGSKLRTGSDPSLVRLDPVSRLDTTEERMGGRLSPRLGRRNPLRMLSNAMDFRSRRKTRPKSADCSPVEDTRKPPPRPIIPRIPPSHRSASVTDLLESVSLSPGPPLPRPLEGHNSAPDLMPGRVTRAHRARLSAAASAKQKLSTRFQPQRKPQHSHHPPHSHSHHTQHSQHSQHSHHSTKHLPLASRRALLPPGQGATAVRRAKTFSLGVQGPNNVQPDYKTLPKQASSRSLGSSSTDSQGSQSAASSRKSSNSSNLSECSRTEISKDALEEIAAFERFIQDYFECGERESGGSSALSEVLELSI